MFVCQGLTDLGWCRAWALLAAAAAFALALARRALAFAAFCAAVSFRELPAFFGTATAFGALTTPGTKYAAAPDGQVPAVLASSALKAVAASFAT